MIEVPDDFLAFLREEEDRSYDGTLLEEVEVAIDSYNGAPYGDEEDGRSQVVARDVSETTDYMLTSIMDVMAGSGRVVEFEPTGEEEEDQCDDATEAMHYIYRRKSGYRFMHDWAKAGLLEKIAVSKSCVERKRQRTESLVPDALLPEDPKLAGIIEAEPTGEFDEMGNALFRIVTIEEAAPSFQDYFVPLEEFRVSPDARDFESAVYLAHICEKSRSELVEMGFDREQVDGLGDESAPLHSTAIARDDGRADWTGLLDRQGALAKVWLREEYVLYDLNDDGIAERLCVHRVGDKVLKVEEVDYQPFEFWCPFPMQGRLIGQSFADKTMDIQRVNTVLERNALDSLYSQLAPGTLLHESAIGENTIEDLLTVRPRRIVRWTGAVAPMPEAKADISETAFNAIEFKIRQRESRTGITRLNKGVDEDTLNDTASGQKALMTRGQQMERYVIRNFGEGVARLFMKKVGLMRRFGQPFRIRVDGVYRDVDPSQWPESMEISVKVGLGSGSKDERIAFRQMIGQAQHLLKEMGSSIVTEENLFNNATGLCKDAGLPPNDLFTNPSEMGPQEAKPDPEMAKVEAEAQLKAQELQAKQEEAAVTLEMKQEEGRTKLELAREETAMKLELERERAALEAELARDRAIAEQQLAQQRFEAELQMNERRMQMEERLAERNAARADVESETKLKKLRPGGDLAK